MVASVVVHQAVEQLLKLQHNLQQKLHQQQPKVSVNQPMIYYIHSLSYMVLKHL